MGEVEFEVVVGVEFEVVVEIGGEVVVGVGGEFGGEFGVGVGGEFEGEFGDENFISGRIFRKAGRRKLRRGKTMTTEKTKTVSVRLPIDLAEALQSLALSQYRSLNAEIVRRLRESIEQDSKQARVTGGKPS